MAVFKPVRHTITNTSSALFSGFHTCSIAFVTSSIYEHSHNLCMTMCADQCANDANGPSKAFGCTSTAWRTSQGAIKHNRMTHRCGCSCHMSLCRGHTSACQHTWHAINVQHNFTIPGQKQLQLGTRMVIFAVQSKRRLVVVTCCTIVPA